MLNTALVYTVLESAKCPVCGTVGVAGEPLPPESDCNWCTATYQVVRQLKEHWKEEGVERRSRVRVVGFRTELAMGYGTKPL